MKLVKNDLYLLLINEETEIDRKETLFIFESDTGLVNTINKEYKKNGFDSKIIAYYPLTKEAKELDLPLLPNPFEETDVEKLSEKANGYAYYGKPLGEKYLAFKEGYKAAQSKQFSLEDMRKAIEMARLMTDDGVGDVFDTESISGLTELCTYGLRDKYSEEEIIQSLSTQQLPKEFIPDTEIGYASQELIDKGFMYEEVLKTITNSEGKEVLVGIYKY